MPRKYTQLLTSQSFLIIGGTSGLGFGVAEALVEEGAARVTVASSNEGKVKDAVKRLEAGAEGSKTKVEGRTVNLKGEKMEESIEALFASLEGSVHHVIHTAGDILAITPLEKTTYETILGAGQVRFFAAILIAKHAAKYLGKHSDSSNNASPSPSLILTTGSISVHPMPDWVNVAGYAGGLSALGRQLAFDLAKKGIRVNVVSPGAVNTEMWDTMGLDEQAKQGLFEKTAKKTLTGKVGQVEQVVQTYLGLIKDSNITGETMYTDSGIRYAS